MLAILPDSDVEHIGSSAILGAISKGDLDVLVGVDKAAVEAAVNKIQMLGFSVKEETLRTESLCMLTTDSYNEDVAIQVVSRGSKFEDFIKFRDILNADPNLVRDYNLLKASCEGMLADEYRLRKSQFIESVLSTRF